MARQRQILHVIGSAVLFGDDVLDVMRQLAVLLPQVTVFTAFASATAREIASWRVHPLLNYRSEMLPSLELED